MEIYTFEKRVCGNYEDFTHDDLVKIRELLGQTVAEEVSFKVYRENETNRGIRRYCRNEPGTCGIVVIGESNTYAISVVKALMEANIDFSCEMQETKTIDRFE